MTEGRFRGFLISFFAVFSVATCTDGNRQEAHVSVRDSAGIQVVESTSQALQAELEWTVSSDPVLEIGLLDGPEEYTFDRIGRALRFADGRMMVPNRRTNELRFFSEAGEFQRTVGGTGEGPGEFRSMSVWLGSADTVWVNDPRLGRLTMLGQEGQFLKSVRIHGESGFGAPTPFGSSPIGGFWVTSATGGFGSGADGLLEGFEIFFSHYNHDGSFDRVITEFQGPSQWAHSSAGMTSAGALPLSISWTVHGANSDHLFLGSGEEPEVQVWNQSGELVRLIRWNAALRPIEGPELEMFKEAFLARWEGSGQEEFWSGWLRDVPFPKVLPTFDKLIIDRTGHLWVRTYQPSWEDSQRWSTFSPDGKWLGEVSVPPTLTITDIGSDYILGIWRDDMDVQYVRMYSLDRGE